MGPRSTSLSLVQTSPGLAPGVFLWPCRQMDNLIYSDDFLRSALRDAKTIAGVGVSANQVRPSWFVMNYMSIRGYRILPVNPGIAGQSLFGQTVSASLSEIPKEEGDIHMVDIFRRSEHVTPIVEEAVATLLDRGLQTIWMQIGVINHEAAAIAEKAGLRVIMNRCPKMEYQRLMGELSWGGINSGIISSKLRR